MTGIGLAGVTVRREILSVRDYNLKRRVVRSVGGGQHDRPDHVIALDDIHLHVEAGTRLGVMGSNGAGKSTLLSVIAGVLAPTSGAVWVEGRVLALLGAGGAGLDVESSGVANVIELGLLLGETQRAMEERLDEIAEFSGLGDRLLSPVYTYSTGMAARLRYSVITSLRPDILVLDEGIGTADAEFTLRAKARTEEFFGSAGILVIASHSAGTLTTQCTDGLWLHEGRVVMRSGIRDVADAYKQFVESGQVTVP